MLNVALIILCACLLPILLPVFAIYLALLFAAILTGLIIMGLGTAFIRFQIWRITRA